MLQAKVQLAVCENSGRRSLHSICECIALSRREFCSSYVELRLSITRRRILHRIAVACLGLWWGRFLTAPCRGVAAGQVENLPCIFSQSAIEIGASRSGCLLLGAYYSLCICNSLYRDKSPRLSKGISHGAKGFYATCSNGRHHSGDYGPLKT